MKRILLFLFLCQAIFTARAQTAQNTLTFSQDALWNTAGAPKDGEGGSYNIPGFDVQIRSILNAGATALGIISFPPYYTQGLTDENGSKGFSIKSVSGLEFQLHEFWYNNWGETGPIVNTVKGYRNSVEVASKIFNFMGSPSGGEPSILVTLDNTFNNVDEVLIFVSSIGDSGNPDVTWSSINNIKLTTPVAPTVASITRVNSSPSNATSIEYLATFSSNVSGVDKSDFNLTATGATGTISTVTGSGKNYTVTVNALAGDGTIRLDLKSSGTGIVDVANAIGILTGFSTGEVYTLDHTAPSISSIVRVGATPTNSSSVDYTVTFSENVTGVDALDFTVTPSGTAAGTIETIIGSGTTYTVTVNSISGEGTLRLDLKGSSTGIQDAVTNVIAAGYTSGGTYTIDRVAPTTTISTAAFSADTGDSSTDFVTRTAAQTISGTLSANMVAGEFVQVSLNNGGTYQNATTSIGNNGWSFVTTLTGSGILKVRVVDAVGNTGAEYSQNYTLDTTSPNTPSTPDLVSASDSGASNTDNITSITTPIFNGTADAGATVTLYDTDGTTVLGSTRVDVNGDWSVTSSTLTSTTHSITAKAKDVAGNTSGVSSVFTITIDNTAPAAPSLPDLASGSDTGTFNGDNITNKIVPTFTGTAESGSTVTLYDTNGTTVLGIGLATGGNWSITSSTLSEGTHSITAKASDAAGNVSSPSSALQVTIDTTAPTQTIANASFSSDTGVSNSDFITNTAAQTISGTLNNNLLSGEAVWVSLDNGTSYTEAMSSAGNNTWSVALTITSSYTLKILVKDIAGNIGTIYSQSYTFDTAAPVTPSKPVSASGNVTNMTTPVFTGIAGVGSTVILYDTDGTTVLGTTVATIGNWSITSSTLSEGLHTVTAKASDAAGNVSSASLSLVITIDITAPTSTIFVANTTLGIGSSFMVTITFNEPVAGFDNSVLTIARGTLSTVSSGDGGKTWTATLTPAPNTSNNSNVIILNNETVMDAAGNVGSGTSSSNNFVIDNIAPVVSSIIRANANPTNASSVDYTVTFSEKVSGVDKNDFSLTNTGSTSGIIANVISTDDKIYTITVNTITGNGAMRLDLKASGTGIADAAANASGGFNSGQVYTFDHSQTITFNPIAAMIYNDATFSLGNANSSGNLPITYTAADPSVVTITGNMAKILKVGSTVITASQAGNGNYDAAANVQQTLTVNKKALTITAEDKVRFAGTADPVFTVKYAGFIGNEDSNVLTTQPTAISTATLNSVPNTYPITVSGAAAANYSFIYVPGILTVKPGAPTSITLAGLPLFENSASGTKAGTLSSTSDDPQATFTYTFVAGAGDMDNASFSIVGNVINTTTPLDFENKSSYSIHVKSTTQYNLSLEKVFTIILSDVNEIPTLAAINNQNICYTTAVQTVPLTGVSAGPETTQTTTLSVSSNNTSLFDNLTVIGAGTTGVVNFKVKAGASGTANVTVTVKDKGGVADGGVDTYSRTFVITINALPVVAINSDKGTQISKGEQVMLSATGGVSYAWVANGSIQSGLNLPSIKVRPLETTTYMVTATNGSGCTETQTFTITVLDDMAKVKANNIMSPNGDGVNDKWLIENIDVYPNNEVKIFDRSGRLMYSKKGYDNSWDATLNGAPLTEGTYYYIIDFGPGKSKVKGFITIPRSN